MKYGRIAAIALVTGLAVILAATPATAGRGNKGNPGILPPHANAFGASYGEWAAGWMQWALGTGANENPLTDETGAFCDVGQQGHVWFLAGTLGDVDLAEVDIPVTTRECVVPSGSALFFPVVNTFYFKTEPEEPTDPDVIWDMLVGWLTADFYCEIDGRPVRNLEKYLTVSPIFDLTIPDDNLWAGYGLPGGTYGPAATAGYYLLLAPLSVGEHTIRIWVRDEWFDEAEGAAMRWGMDVNYTLDVAPQRNRGRRGK